VARQRAGKTVRRLANEVHQPAATIGGYFSGQHLPPLRQGELFREILRCLGIVDSHEIDRWLEALDRVRRKPGPRPSSQPTPYRGLESFGPDDARWFFGREALCHLASQKLAACVSDPTGNAMLAVVGPSGAGKSSLLCAGLVPRVTAGSLNMGGPWRHVILTPGTDPMASFAQRLVSLCPGTDPAQLTADLRAHSVDWPTLLGEGSGLLVVVDQFEELFTECPEESARQAFITTLLAATAPTAGTRRLAVVIGLRSDFYGQAVKETGLVPVLQDNQLLVGPMSIEQLRRAIVEPARVAGYGVDSELVDALLDEFVPMGVAGAVPDVGALPLLSHALLETWRRARRGQLTIADYRATGGIGGAVHQTAERVFAELTTEERMLARRMFLRLVQVGDDMLVTRRRVSRAELPSDSADRLVDRFVAQRLLTAHDSTVEICHDALLRAWSRLAEWVAADREDLRVHRQLSEAARMWADSEQDPACLLRGNRLEAAQAWAAALDHRDDLALLEEAFLSASAEEARSEEQVLRRRNRRLQGLSAVVAALALIAAALAVVAVRARDDAVVQRDAALSRQVAEEATAMASSDPSLARQLALAAYRTSPTVDATSALLDSSGLPTETRLLGQPGATAEALGDNGHLLAVSRAIDGSVQLFSLPPARAPLRRSVLPAPTSGTQLFAMAFRPDAHLLATGGTEDVVRLWDVTNPDRPRLLGRPLRGFTAAVESLAFSPDGHALVAGGGANAVLRWDVTDPAAPIPLPPLAVGRNTVTQTVAFTPNGALVAAGGSDSTIRLWSAVGPSSAPIAQVVDGVDTVDAIAFSPDGSLLAAGAKDRTVRLWDVAEPKAPTPVGPVLSGFGSWVNAVAFSPDGRLLAAGSSDNTVRLWQVDGWQAYPTVLNGPQPVTGVAFLGNDQGILTVAEDGTARLWSLPGPVIGGPTDSIFGLSFSQSGRLAVFPNEGDPDIEVWNASDRTRPSPLGKVALPAGIGALDGSGALSPNGRYLAAGTTTGRVQLFDVTDPAAPSPLGPALSGPTKQIEEVAFAADGHFVAAASDDGTVGLWNVSDPNHPVTLATLTGPTSLVLNVAFDPRGQLIAAASADKTVRLWDISNPRRPSMVATLRGFANYAYSVAFSPDDRLLAAGSADRTIRLWDITTPGHPRSVGPPIIGPTDYVISLAFAPTGHTLAAAVANGTLWDWDVTNPAHPERLATIDAATGGLNAVAFSPDGQTMAAAGNGKVVYLWDADPTQVVEDICRTAGDPLTSQEWAQYVPGQRYRSLC
jgi:WD40 repeat protein